MRRCNVVILYTNTKDVGIVTWRWSVGTKTCSERIKGNKVKLLVAIAGYMCIYTVCILYVCIESKVWHLAMFCLPQTTVPGQRPHADLQPNPQGHRGSALSKARDQGSTEFGAQIMSCCCDRETRISEGWSAGHQKSQVRRDTWTGMQVQFHRDCFNRKNSMVWVRGWTIPTERLLLVGKVIANVCG
jgi:hypothetical protein